jgi:hypothetical protein
MKKVKKMAFGGMSNKPMDPKMKAGLAGMQGSAQLGAMNKMLAGQNPGGRGLGNIASRPTGGPKPAPAGMSGFGRASQEGLDFLRKQPIGVMGQSGPGALDMTKTAGPGLASPGFAGPGFAGPGARPPGMKKGGKVSSASKRADGIAVKGKTRGKIV